MTWKQLKEVMDNHNVNDDNLISFECSGYHEVSDISILNDYDGREVVILRSGKN